VPFAGRYAWTAAVDRWIGYLTEPLAAVLLVVEVAILAAGVFSRYVMHNALVWTDEVATILLLWLAMLGAVSAYRRREHIRLTAIVRRVRPDTASLMEVISAVVVAIFALELFPASRVFLIQEQTDMTPCWHSTFDIVASIVFALIAFLVISVLRLVERRRSRSRS